MENKKIYHSPYLRVFVFDNTSSTPLLGSPGEEIFTPEIGGFI